MYIVGIASVSALLILVGFLFYQRRKRYRLIVPPFNPSEQRRCEFPDGGTLTQHTRLGEDPLFCECEPETGCCRCYAPRSPPRDTRMSPH